VLQLEARQARKLGRRLKKLTRRLGGVREVDVLTQLLDEIQQAARAPARALRRVREEVRNARDEARRCFLHESVSDEFRRVSRKLERIAAGLADTDRRQQRGRGWRWAVEARVAHRASALKVAINTAGPMYMPGRLHQVRIALKKLRYGMELSAEVAGSRETSALRALKRGQDLLGRLRDLQILIERVRRVQSSLMPANIAAWHELDVLVVSLEHSCRRLHARYVHNRGHLMALCDRYGARGGTIAVQRAM
jgi:CHAD domain-containing protein